MSTAAEHLDLGSGDLEPTGEGTAAEEPTGDLRSDLEAAFSEHSDEEPAGGRRETTRPDEPGRGRETATATPGDGEALAAPVSWTEEARAAFDALPDNVQREIAKREREIDAGLRESADGRKVLKALEPFQSAIREAGIDPQQYVTNLINWNGALRADPVQAIDRLLQAYVRDRKQARAIARSLSSRFDVDSFDLDDDMDDGDRRGPVRDDRVDKLLERENRREVQAALAEWDSFKATKDDGGRLRYPYAEELRQDMADALRAKPQLTYAEAYEIAQYQNADIRERVIQDRLAAEEAKRVNGGRERQRKGRQLDLPAGRSAGVNRAQESAGNVRADILSSMEELGVRIG